MEIKMAIYEFYTKANRESAYAAFYVCCIQIT